MKRVLFLLTGMLMIALMVFSVSGSAQITDHATSGSFMCCDHSQNVCDVSFKDGIALRNEPKLLDAQPATEIDADEIKEDGINTRVATVWIVCISVVFFIAIMILAVILAKKNQGEK